MKMTDVPESKITTVEGGNANEKTRRQLKRQRKTIVRTIDERGSHEGEGNYKATWQMKTIVAAYSRQTNLHARLRPYSNSRVACQKLNSFFVDYMITACENAHLIMPVAIRRVVDHQKIATAHRNSTAEISKS